MEADDVGGTRSVKDLLDKLTELYPPPYRSSHELRLGRDGRLQLSVWAGGERVPMSFDDEDLGKGTAELLEDVRRLVAIYRHARKVGGRPFPEQLSRAGLLNQCVEAVLQLCSEMVDRQTTGLLLRSKAWPAGELKKLLLSRRPPAFAVANALNRAGVDQLECETVLKGIDYVMRQRQPHGCTVRLSLAERFLDWYAGQTKLYIRGQRGKDWDEQRRLDAELAVALEPFLRQLVDEEVGIRLAEQQIERGYSFGREAEELRRGLEELIQGAGDDGVDVEDLQGLLDGVDARDSLAWLERQEAGPVDQLCDALRAAKLTPRLRGVPIDISSGSGELRAAAAAELATRLATAAAKEADDEEPEAGEEVDGG